MRKIISKIALAFAIFGCLGSGVARAGNISLDVTASNISGVASKDPYSRKEAKGDNDQKFYIKLTSLTNGPSLNFTSYSSDHVRVSTALTYPGHPLGTTSKTWTSILCICFRTYELCKCSRKRKLLSINFE